jgi:hypothetical protein
MRKGSLKMKNAAKKAHKTEKNALLFTKYKLGQFGWRFLDFQSKKGYPRTGIIDMIAVKLDKEDPDKLKIILFQVKGGVAKMTGDEVKKLQKACKKIEVACNYAEKPEKVVRFNWEPTDEEFKKVKS